MNEAEAKGKEIEAAINELISQIAKYRGHITIIDKLHNKFILRVEEPIRINVYEGYKGETENGGKQ